MNIEQNKQLKPYNTFGISVYAKFFAEVQTEEELLELQQRNEYRNNPVLVLGGGSNILFTKDFDGLVLRNALPGISIVRETENDALVKVAAGEVWHRFVLWTIEQNLGGVENLSLIPGLAGAAPMQNIGAYGVEIKDVFEELEAVHCKTGEKQKFGLIDCEFGYRESVFKNKLKDEFIITSVTLRLVKVLSPKANYRFKTDYGDIKNTLAQMQVSELTLKTISDAVIKIRTSKLPDPAQLGNAGSFFKNPVITKQQFDELALRYPAMPSYWQVDGTVKIPAGWLIEQCGWKGKVIGNTGAHAKQALVLVNYGNATGKEIENLALEIRQSVKEKFGIEIQPEVNIV